MLVAALYRTKCERSGRECDVGQNADVPRLSMPGDMPERVLITIDVIGNNVSTEILRRLARKALTAREIADQIGVHVGSVHRHLVVLEQHELVTTDVDPGKRRGQTVIWRTDTAKVAQCGEVWVRYASGAD